MWKQNAVKVIDHKTGDVKEWKWSNTAIVAFAE